MNNKMNVYVTTCNQVSYLLEGYAELFNKHWSKDQNVIVLGYDNPPCELPQNFSFHSLGKQRGKDWSSALKEYFESINDDYFFLCMEDQYIIDDLDVETMNEVINLFETTNVDKVWCSYIPNIKNGIDHSDNLWKWSPTSKYDPERMMPSSIGPSIWRREFLLSLLKPGYTCWDFELKNIDKWSRDMVMYHPKKRFIYEELDAFRRHKFNDTVFGPHWRIKDKSSCEEDLKIFRKMKEKYENRSI